ncbi:tyrosine-type recombinase/integrase [Vibrio scophthalmi]|uniref:tyrosine-type recombinase/integrase n=1 Tax=Vibrio scophthalmi TaxID=45658 RepID=UPI003872EE54
MNNLHDKNIKAVFGKQHSEASVLSDGQGLSARVSTRGKVRWQYRYKILGKNKRMDLGDYPALSLAQARESAQQCRSWLAQGHDPKLQRDLARSESLQAVTVKDALEYWLVEYAEDHRANVSRHRAQFERHIYPYIGHLPIDKTEIHHWLECFDRVRKGIAGKQRPAPVAAGSVLQNAKQALRFCRVRRYSTSRVLDDLTVNDVGKKQEEKDRVLKASELVDLWNEIQKGEKFPSYYRNLAKLLVIFGTRTREVRLSTWSEWDFDEMIWTVPEEHSKSGKKIRRPIPEYLVPWLMNLQLDGQGSDLILGMLKRPEAVSQYGRLVWKRFKHAEEWTLHDIRRTFCTRLNELGIAPHVVEQMLGHSLGGVMAIYNRSEYIPQKIQALDMWLEHLDAISDPTHKVVSISCSQR